uniref:Uncharacterized protein n=1 Tax=Gouania willdenowi TaxID=441366 RepID=A0A8C5E7W0_GOUWI
HQSGFTFLQTFPPSYFLEIFDDEEYDCRTPDGWLSLGTSDGHSDHKPIPAKALLPNADHASSDATLCQSVDYSWHLVGVLHYSLEKHQYLVQKVLQRSGYTDTNKSQIPTPKILKPIFYWVPRIRLLFSGEDPRIFVERIQFALNHRALTEARLFQQLAVDCMPRTPSLSSDSLQRIKALALSTPGLRCETSVKSRLTAEEIKLEYDCIMNRVIFEQLTKDDLKDFLHFTLPPKEHTLAPLKGRIKPLFINTLYQGWGPL